MLIFDRVTRAMSAPSKFKHQAGLRASPAWNAVK